MGPLYAKMEAMKPIAVMPLKPVCTPCPYIRNEASWTERAVIADADEEGIEILLKNGYRHFGRFLFRPVCSHCRKCVPVRIPLKEYRDSRNRRRVLSTLKKAGLSFSLEEPLPDMELFELYTKHKQRFPFPEEQEEEDYDSFVDSFFSPTPGAKLLRLRDGEKTVAVSHIDLLADTISAVYCYWDSSYADYSPGKAMILQEAAMGKEFGKSFLCLGYLVEENSSMIYKRSYYPLEYSPAPGIWRRWIDADGTVWEKAKLPPRFYISVSELSAEEAGNPSS